MIQPVQVVKRDGRLESVKFDKVTARIEKLCYGLNMDYVSAIDIAKKVYKPEIYKQAAELLLKEGKIAKGDVPWDTDGFKAPQSEFIDGITFNGKEPNAYLANFPIGLKADEIVKKDLQKQIDF